MVGTATAEALSHNRVNLEQVLVGAGGAIANLRSLVAQVAPKMANVLLQGESGTGKEVVARAIHDCSTRSRAPFVAVNCGAIPAELLESELFGHEKGAFTGAVAARKGRFELAEGGTLFLDEIGDMPFDMQVKLLRVLQERTFERVGGTKVQKANVRIVAATHQNLEGKVESGDFRMDLYYRLNVFPIDVPPLRDRPEDIPLLAQRFIDLQQEQNGEAISLSRDALTQLCQCEWQGNIRELGNLVERLTILYPGEVVDTQKLPGRYAASQADWVQTPRHDPEAVAKFIDDLFKDMDDSTQEKVAVLPTPVDNNAEDLSGLFATVDQLPPVTPHVVDFTIGDIDLKQHLAEIEKDLIFAALEHSDWVNAQAAKRLNLQRTTLVEKMRKYDISRT
ncbi:Probable response regulator of flagellar motility [marine gamma proteobacterium HTCC2080]|jgi:sigma-54 specific flagellar transcriptional regulator A|nr:Probable response regulator of flagellar motility [marine gamma proteobacterium HTCC2080]